MHNCSIVQSYPIVTWLHQTQGRVGIETYMYVQQTFDTISTEAKIPQTTPN